MHTPARLAACLVATIASVACRTTFTCDELRTCEDSRPSLDGAADAPASPPTDGPASPRDDAAADASSAPVPTPEAGAVDAGTTDAGTDAGPPSCGAAPVNACGGCTPLKESIGDACGICGAQTCNGWESTRCEDPGYARVVQVTAGGAHTCALLSSGVARCWGRNDKGQLGDGTQADRISPPAADGYLHGFKAIAAGSSSTCAVTKEGAVQCWGDNAKYQLGDGTNLPRPIPVSVLGITNAVEVAVGFAHACALLADGAVRCWGDNFDGQLGDGTREIRTVPVSAEIARATSIFTGTNTTCAIDEDGIAWCWGWNYQGLLGTGIDGLVYEPAQVAQLESVKQIGLGKLHGCALTNDGRVHCWGSNAYGAVGDGGDRETLRTAPSLTKDIANATHLAVGVLHNCVRLEDGRISCWGRGGAGLGNGGTIDTFEPRLVYEVFGASGIAVGGDHGCASLAGTGLRCWGLNTYGAVGDGTVEERSIAVPVPALDRTCR